MQTDHKLGISISNTDPCVEGKRSSICDGKQTCDAVISIQDSIKACIEHESARGRDATALRAQLAIVEESFTASGQVREGIILSEEMRSYKAVDDICRAWMESNLASGYISPIPTEISNRLDALMIERVHPSRINGDVVDGSERPSVILDQRNDPQIENLGRHTA